MATDKAPTPLTPEQQIKALQVQLKEAQEKANLFEAVLDVLKKDYGVCVVRKPLGKLVDDNYLGRRIDSSVLLPELTRCLT
jgi:hypothetical protein